MTETQKDRKTIREKDDMTKTQNDKKTERHY